MLFQAGGKVRYTPTWIMIPPEPILLACGNEWGPHLPTEKSTYIGVAVQWYFSTLQTPSISQVISQALSLLFLFQRFPSPTHPPRFSLLTYARFIWLFFSVGFLVFDWYVVSWGLTNKHHIDMCLEEIGLHLLYPSNYSTTHYWPLDNWKNLCMRLKNQ